MPGADCAGLRVHDPHRHPGTRARRAPRPLLQSGQRRRHRHQGGQGSPRVETRLARQAGIHHDGHARNRQGRLCDRRGEDDAAPRGGGQGAILLGGAQLSVQRENRDAGQAQAPAHGLDLADAGQEHQEGPGRGRHRVLDHARHVRQVLPAHPHALRPQRAHGLHAARGRGITHLEGVDLPRDVDERRIGARGVAQQGGRGGGLQRGRGQGDEQVLAQGRARIQRERQRQVRVQVALVKLVNDEGRHARKLRVPLKTSQGHARGHHLHPGRLAHPRVPAHRVADLAAHLLPEEASDPAGRRPCGDAPRLGDQDPRRPLPATGPCQGNGDGHGQQRRLARARGSRDERASARVRRSRDVAQRARHRQVGRAGEKILQGRHALIVRCGASRPHPLAPPRKRMRPGSLRRAAPRPHLAPRAA